MSTDDMALPADRAVVPSGSSQQAVSPVPASIPSAFPTAESTRRLPGEDEIEWADRTYGPSFPGIHICGADHEENRFFTIFDAPMSEVRAVSLFSDLRETFSVDEDAADFVVDLNTLAGHEDDFWSNRQMLPALAQAIEARRAETQGGSVHESAVRKDAP